MSKKSPVLAIVPKEPKAKVLSITPQISVLMHGTYPDQWLTVEAPNQSATRKKITLTPENAYSTLFDILAEKAGGIELDRQLAEERRSKPVRRNAQPDWRLIAKHPEATIIERLATRAPELKADKATNTLEEMGL